MHYSSFKRPLFSLVICLFATAILAALFYGLAYQYFKNGLYAEIGVLFFFLILALFSLFWRGALNPLTPSCETIMIWLLYRLYFHVPGLFIFKANFILTLASILLLLAFWFGAWYLIVKVAVKNRFGQTYGLATRRIAFLFAGQVLLANFLMRAMDGSLIFLIF